MSQTNAALAAVHEMGHALGLWQHSTNTSDVMYPVALNGIPSKRDRNTVYKLYNTSAHVTNAVREPSVKDDDELLTFTIECGQECMGH